MRLPNSASATDGTNSRTLHVLGGNQADADAVDQSALASLSRLSPSRIFWMR
jgi:hypothetical protein